jgi:ferritin
LNEALVDEERLDKSVIEILNKQIKNELNSSQMYRAMSCWLDDQKWPASTKTFFKYADEELTHMSKIYQYLFDRNCKVTVPTCDEQKDDFKDIHELVEAALQHEIDVTKNWEDISELAKDKKDNTTHEFAEWFLKEQIEEEDKMRTIIEKMDLDMPKYEVDCYIGTL